LGVVTDLEIGDAVALCVLELEGREDTAAVITERAFGIELAVEAWADGVAVVQAERRGVSEGSGQGLFERGTGME
jgi:hypothetical protein